MRSSRPLIAVMAAILAIVPATSLRSQPVTASPPSAAPAATPAPATAPAAASDDPYLWLEEVNGQRAMTWVNAQNTRSIGHLEADPRYRTLHEQALAIVNATDRIPYPSLMGRTAYNFWQDATNVRGLWRRVPVAQYGQAAPPWETVLDLDELSRRENANWVWEGADCLQPQFRRCLISLSNGGEDAAVVREFDLTTRQFVTDGFNLPTGKQTVTWIDENRIIVAREWGPGTMTTSGYPFVVRIQTRGQPATGGQEVFRGQASDVGVFPSHMQDGDGRHITLIQRAVSFFETEYYIPTASGVLRVPLPAKSSVQGVANGSVFVTLQEPWTFGGRTYPLGALVALRGLMGDNPNVANMRVQLVFAPTPRQSIEQVAFTAHHAVAAIYDNVRGSIVRFAEENGAWRPHTVVPPGPLSVGITTTSDVDETYYYNTQGFLAPSQLVAANAANDAPGATVKSLPARFDASRLTVSQYEATSTDGTRVPYFVVHRRDMPLDGSNPTMLYAYGGFQNSELPVYSPAIGRLWLERGGVYVLANIRGGGEFGPAWHQAGLKTNRQRVFDDFTAVGRDLITRRITSPRRLGIEGGSNGGLLMGVQMTQHPELFRAVVIQVPLLDMVRYTQIGAGASWEGEYGNPADPVEGAFLRGISPYHNLRAGTAYPTPFFVTSTGDDRVTPVHARKMAARMEEMRLPFLYYENTQGGHAAAANLQERARRVALEFTYLSQQLID